MKKITLLILALALVLGLCACGQKAATGGTPTWQEQYDLGVRYLSEGNYEEAIIAFTAAIEIDPKRPEAYLDMAYAYIGQNDFDAARDILEKGYELTQDSSLKDKLDELDSENITDYAGNIRRESFYGGSGVLMGYQTFTYDSQNRKSSAASFDADGNRTGYVDIAYDAEGHMLTRYSYDSDDGTIFCRHILEYDSSGNRVKEEVYNLDTGRLLRYFLCQYDVQQNLTREDNYDADGELVSYAVYTYEENGKRRDEYIGDGTPAGYSIVTYREDGQTSNQCCWYDADGTLWMREDYHYNDGGNRIGYDVYDGEGNLISSTVYE